MKKLLLPIIFFILLTSCGRNDGGETTEPPAPAREAAPVTMQSTIPFDTAALYFSELETLFAIDNGTLWGICLNVPFAFVNPQTLEIVANRQDPQGILTPQGLVYAGVLPQGFHAGYGVHEFGGEWWAMVPWDIMEAMYGEENRHARLRYNSHLAFHRTQQELFDKSLFFWGNPHMDEPSARANVIMEARALAIALESHGEERLAAIGDALAIRAERRRLFPEYAVAENVYEIHEGVAQYTELRLNYQDIADIIHEINAAVYNMKILPSIAWNFAYWTGAAYGFLLDEFSPAWRESVDARSDLAQMLKLAAGITELPPFGEINLYLYGYAQIHEYANAPQGTEIRLLKDILAELSAQPTLQIPMGLGALSGSPEPRFTIHGMGRIYGAGIVFSGSFGEIRLYEGYFLAFRSLGRAMFTLDGFTLNEPGAAGHGWELTLNDGYAVIPEWPWEGASQIVQRYFPSEHQAGQPPPEPNGTDFAPPPFYGYTSPYKNAMLDAELGVLVFLGDSKAQVIQALGDPIEYFTQPTGDGEETLALFENFMVVTFVNDMAVRILTRILPDNKRFAVYGTASHHLEARDLMNIHILWDFNRSAELSEQRDGTVWVFNNFYDAEKNRIICPDGYGNRDYCMENPPEGTAFAIYVEWEDSPALRHTMLMLQCFNH